MYWPREGGGITGEDQARAKVVGDGTGCNERTKGVLGFL